MGKTIIQRSEIPAACDERFAPVTSDIYVPWRRLGIVRSGISHLVPGYHMGRPVARQQMLILCTGGRGYAFHEAQEWSLESGCLFMSGTNSPIAFGCAGDHWDIYWWYAEGDQSDFDYYCEPYAHAGILAAAMEALFEEAGDVPREREWTDEAPVRNRERALRLSELIATYLSDLIQAPDQLRLDKQEQQLQTLWREVDRTLHQDWDIKAFAAFLDVSTATVQRWMHKYYGKSCHQLLIDRRMYRSRQLLLHTAYTLENIAEQLGYCDAFTFSNAFKKYTGRSPAQFRELA